VSALSPSARVIVERMGAAPRGPERDSLFALWLVVRVVEDLALDPPLSEKGQRRRVELLSRRVGSLMMPPALRRPLTAALKLLESQSPADAARALQGLDGPVRAAFGNAVAEAIGRATPRGA